MSAQRYNKICRYANYFRFCTKKSPKLAFQTFLLSNGLACYASAAAAGSSAGASSPLASASAAAAS